MKGTFKVLLLVSIAVAVGVGTVLATTPADDVYGLLWVRDRVSPAEDGDIKADGDLEIYGLRAKIGLDSENNGARLLFGTPEDYQEEKLVARGVRGGRGGTRAPGRRANGRRPRRQLREPG